MKYLLMLFAFSFMLSASYAQRPVNDESLRYQEERMVFKQWDQNKFTPKPGFLSLNPYYWLVWGLFHPSYHETDRRPLSAAGPQTQRLALVSTMNSIDNNYALNADTVMGTAMKQIYATEGIVSGADPLWLLYYKQQFVPVLNYSMPSLMAGLSTQVTSKLITEGTVDWYSHELDMLAERINGAHTADMDRGSRIMAYYRLLKEYRSLAGVWAIKVSTAQKGITMTAQRQQLHNGKAVISDWSPGTDVKIANSVLLHAKY